MTLQPELAGLVLIAAISHALWNAFVKSSGERAFTMTVVLLGPAVAGIVLVLVFPLPARESWLYLGLGALVHTVYYVCLLAAYRVGDLSQVYPLARGAAPLIVAGGAFLFAGEALAPLGIAGVLLASLGIMSLALERGVPRADGFAPVLYALLTGLCIAGYTMVDGIGVRKSGEVLAYIGWLNILKPLPILTWVAVRRGRAFVHYTATHWRFGLTGGVFNLFAYTLVLYALAYGAMAHVTALRETSVIFAAAIGAIALKEGFGARRILAAAMVAGGAGLLLTGG
jgi:drug/metabolite transporter (DMT)-like permease